MSASTTSLANVMQRFCLVLALALCAPTSNCSLRAESLNGAVATQTCVQGTCVAWTWSKLFSPIERTVGNQAGMIRFGIIALCSALYIIWWRK